MTLAVGLKEPELVQDEIFKAILYRTSNTITCIDKNK